jgi:2-oxo-4-hydroxy-4-carboxy-5-ureidoimidazoline decarboxylase
MRHISPVPERCGLDELNAMDRATFTRALGAVFEHSPWVAERAWSARPFAAVAELHQAMLAIVQRAPDADQLALLRAHPDLAGKAARAGAMSPTSMAEQAAAGFDRLTDAQYEHFHRLNAAYRAKFEFPFIIAVRAHDTPAIVAAFEERLRHTRAQEVEAALAQVAQIAWLRLEAMVEPA